MVSLDGGGKRLPDRGLTREMTDFGQKISNPFFGHKRPLYNPNLVLNLV